MAVILLHEQDQRYATEALGAVEDSYAGVRALGDLAADLARASGRDPEAPRETARDLGFGVLDGPYRQWLAGLGTAIDPGAARTAWQITAHRILSKAADRQLTDSGETGWLDDAASERVFRARLNRAFPLRHDPGPAAEKADISEGVSR
ncbi:type I-E CRISPR-associated protein Cse1/CasA [Streptomyces sp. NPDC059538]|uniref:type I-E CRISPR-associated protein Cse1/CasA n=1 Tax=Streptomyces sp. NPDC059538 TaxID=3346860 RepID=UPI0036A0245E